MESQNPDQASSIYRKETDPNGTIILNPISQKHEFTLIFIHGLGETAALRLKHFEDGKFAPPNCKIVLPQA